MIKIIPLFSINEKLVIFSVLVNLEIKELVVIFQVQIFESLALIIASLFGIYDN